MISDNQVPSVTSIPLSRGWGRLRIGERRILLFLGDLVVLSVSLALALYLMSRSLGLSSWGDDVQVHWWYVLWAVWLPIAVIGSCYDLERASRPVEGAVYVAAWAAGASVLYLLVPLISAPLTSSRVHFFVFAASVTFGIGLWRMIYAQMFTQAAFRRRVLVVGASHRGRDLVRTLTSSTVASGLQVLGFVDDDERLRNQRIDGYPVLANSESLVALVEQLRVDEIVLAINNLPAIRDGLLSALVRCWSRGVAVVPEALYLEEVTHTLPVERSGLNIFALVNSGDGTLQRLWDATRRLIDIVVGAVGLALLLPFLPIIALAIKLDSRGDVFYRQQRVGQAGKIYWIIKFRSMIQNAEPNGAQWSRNGDSRITRVGRFMRKTRMDELPQLWNLLVGDMSLIGPRPERPEFVQQLERDLPFYAIRYSVKPGLTGWAQVSYRYGSNEEDALIKLRYDLYYVKHRGPLLDAMIVLSTIRVVLAMQGT